MSVMTQASPAAFRWRALRQLTVTELKLFGRDRIGPVWGVGFPAVLMIIFGSIPAFHRPRANLGGYTTLDSYVPVVIVMSMALLTLVAMPAVLAGYREMGVLRRLRTTPAGPVRVLAAQLLVNCAVAVVSVVLILAVARIGYGVFLPRQLAGFTVSVLLTLAAMLAIGLLVAAVAPNSKAAPVIGQLLFFPLLFFSGMWWPIPMMPPALRHVAEATPLGAGWQAMTTAAVGQWPGAVPLLVLAAYLVVFGWAAARLFRWE